MTALRNLLGDLAAQLRRPGGRLPRIACVLRYWALYWRARRRGLSQEESRLAALAGLAGAGARRRTVTMTLDGGLRAELDVFSAAYLAREVVDEGTYRAPGFVPEPGWTVVDVGAHQGLFTLDAARRAGPSGRVVAVEASAENRVLLERNVAANRLAQVSVVPFAASDARGTRALYVTPHTTGGQSLLPQGADKGAAEVAVETETLDAILAARGVERADLLKVDVEGAWRLVFAGAPRLLAARPRVVMEVEGGEDEVAAAMARLRELGYTVERRGAIVFARPGNS